MASGAVLAIFMAILNVVRGMDVWMGTKFAAAPFLGERALQPGFDGPAVAAGVVSHLAISAAWGVMFGVLFYGLARGVTVAAGVLWGFVVWIGMYYVVMPVVGLAEAARSVPIMAAILNHVFFGVILALAFLPFQRRLPRVIVHRTQRPILR